MSEEPFKAILAILSRKDIAHVHCAGLSLDDQKLELLITAIEHSPSDTKVIDLSNNSITSAGVVPLVRFLQTTPVQSVDLRNNQIDEDGALVFLSLFQKKTSLESLDLRGNACSLPTAFRLYYLCKSAQYPDVMRSALFSAKAQHISFAGMSYSDLEKDLLQYLFHIEGLESVDFSGIDLGAGGMAVAGTLLKDAQVSALSFSNCTLSDETVLKFIEASDLANHCYLKSFDFSFNMGLTNDLVRKLIPSVFDQNNYIVNFVLTDTCVTPMYRELVQKECELNQENLAIKRAVVALRRNSPAAQEINLQWDAPLPMCMHYLADLISASSVIQHLNISNTLVDDSGLELLSRALRKNSSLKVIELANCDITATGIEALFGALGRGDCTVEEVNIANNNLDESSVKYITGAIRANPNLKTLNVEVNPSISAASIQEIAGLTMVNRAPPRIRSILPSIENNGKDVISLDFSDNGVTLNDDAVWILAQALRLNTSVRRLNLSHNSFGDTGASYLADCIGTNRTLVELDLSSCAIGNRGARNLCAALATNQALRTVDLSDNMIDADSLSGLLLVLRQNNTLRELKLARTRVVPEFVERVRVACSLNCVCAALKDIYYRLLDGDTSLTKIDLSNCDDERPVDDEGVRSICDVLRNNTVVNEIDLRGSRISAGGCSALAALLSESTCKVRKVDLSQTTIDDRAVEELVACFPKNETLREILLYDTNITNTGIGIITSNLEKNSSILFIGITDGAAVGEQMAPLQRNLSLNSGPAALKRLVLSINAGETVDDVNLSRPVDCSIDDSMCQILCASLMHSRTLWSLKLSHNSITSASVPYILEVVEACPSLVFLDLSDNQIDECGAQQIIACLENVANLRGVRVTGNFLSNETCERISHLVSMNLGSEELKKLHLVAARGEPLPKDINLNGATTTYQLTDAEVVVLAGLLQESSSVKAVDLGSNSFSDEGCIAIAEVLRVNHTLLALNLSGNAIGANGGEALYFALKVNPQLQFLGLENTAIPRDILEDIASLLHVNQTPYRAVIDMRGVKIDELNDATMFGSTDYYRAQVLALEDEAIESCKRSEVQLIEQKM
ncbi:hypothetical protein LSCM1_00455 [Leishmania martiniquensis]|uniref:Paraflagellar rod component n=1 Tax=Leishmania martiniquensis TaxID=1580590 RepID=A0A836G2U0_9TRYP|nr:hypothetical protein LSCM1_00455 [Leishmania martiniquensis]